MIYSLYTFIPGTQLTAIKTNPNYRGPNSPSSLEMTYSEFDCYFIDVCAKTKIIQVSGNLHHSNSR